MSAESQKAKAAFRDKCVRDALTAKPDIHVAEISRITGYPPQTVMRALKSLIETRKAYQSGWYGSGERLSVRIVPTYSNGRKPAGFVIPNKPDPDAMREARREREARYEREQRITEADPLAPERLKLKREQRLIRKRQRSKARYDAMKEQLNKDARERYAERKAAGDTEWLRKRTGGSKPKPKPQTVWAGGHNPFHSLLSNGVDESDNRDHNSPIVNNRSANHGSGNQD
jgi:hypothetical protein